ncbi:MAG: hypothetical protein RIR53_1841 [Bacteroidota bacterium]
MRPDLQRDFNARVNSASHSALVSSLENRIGAPIEFRICEMPIMISEGFAREMSDAACEIIAECLLPENVARSESTLESRYRVKNESSHPLFSVVDFAVTIDDHGAYRPKLIELQGFPSLFGYQSLLAQQYIDIYQLKGFTPYLSRLDEASYRDHLCTAIFAGHDPAEVALVEIDPESQKTRPDFLAMRELIGLQTVNIRDIEQQGRDLFFSDATGQRRPLRRIFNRAIIDELDELGVELPFRWNDELNVEWAGHPNWYFRISKFLLPYLQHTSVPRTVVVSDLTEYDADVLGNAVLKPLYAFAGKGVNVSPTLDDIRAIPVHERSQWILQERVRYAPCVPTPEGDNFVEIRIMLLWPDSMVRPLPVMTLARTGRGALMGARYNVLPWTGSSGCLITQ